MKGIEESYLLVIRGASRPVFDAVIALFCCYFLAYFNRHYITYLALFFAITEQLYLAILGGYVELATGQLLLV